METSQNENSKLKKGALILVLSSVLVKIISALFKIPLASDFCLGDLGFGYFSSAHDVFMPIYFVAVSGFPVAISHIVADYISKGNINSARLTLKESKKLVLSIGVVSTVLYLLCVFPFVRLTDKTGNSIYSFLAVAPTIIFCLWAACYRGFYEGLGNMKPAAVSNVIEALGKLVLGLGFALAVIKFTNNMAYASAASIIGISIGSLISALYLKFKYKANDGLGDFCNCGDFEEISQKDIMKKLIVISIPIVAVSLSNSAMALIDGITVRYQLSNLITQNADKFTYIYSSLITELEVQTKELISNDALPTVLYGIRSKAYTLFNLIPTLTMAIGVGLIPVVTQSFSKGDNLILKTNVSAVFKLSALICFPAGAGYIVFGYRVMSLLYGNGTSSQIGGKMLLFYGIAAIFAGFSLPLASILQAIGKQKRALINVFCGILLKIVLNILLCNVYEINIYGSVYSTVCGFGLILLMHLFCIFKNIGIPSDLINNVLKPAIASVICVGIAFLVSLLSDSSFVTAVSILVAAVVYLISLVLLRAFDDSDILAFPMGEHLLKFCKKIKIID